MFVWAVCEFPRLPTLQRFLNDITNNVTLIPSLGFITAQYPVTVYRTIRFSEANSVSGCDIDSEGTVSVEEEKEMEVSTVPTEVF
jgi:hypothetical protein